MSDLTKSWWLLGGTLAVDPLAGFHHAGGEHHAGARPHGALRGLRTGWSYEGEPAAVRDPARVRILDAVAS